MKNYFFLFVKNLKYNFSINIFRFILNKFNYLLLGF